MQDYIENNIKRTINYAVIFALLFSDNGMQYNLFTKFVIIINMIILPFEK